MEDKNRFSILLEHLLEVAEVKNYTLAKRLQYDVSYISKWVSGRMLPAKKTEKRVMEGISACVVDEATDDGRDLLLREYSVSIPSDLKAAIYDNLIAEYDYLQEELDSGEARIGPYTDFWAELNMLQYLTKMAHPVLRRVSQLDIVAVPLRYNYDKPEKPRISRVFGYLARFFILFQTEKSSREVVIS